MSTETLAPVRAMPSADTPRAVRLATFLPYRLNVLAAVVSEGLARTYSERFRIGVPEWRVLATVAEFQSITATAIGQHAHMGKVKVSRAAASLEARGLLRRLANETDLRESFLVLTPAGQAMYGEVATLALAYTARLEAHLSDAESRALSDLITKVTAIASTLDPAEL